MVAQEVAGVANDEIASLRRCYDTVLSLTVESPT